VIYDKPVPQPPGRPILLANAVGMLARAQGFAHRTPVAAKAEIASIELEARNLRAWLSDVAADGALEDIASRLVTLAQRLDVLEDSLRGHEPAADRQN
jgi:hypothetical protein